MAIAIPNTMYQTAPVARRILKLWREGEPGRLDGELVRVKNLASPEIDAGEQERLDVLRAVADSLQRTLGREESPAGTRVLARLLRHLAARP